MLYDIAVVGGGPAGLSAAIQGRTRGKSVVVISGDIRDNALYKARQVDNYLGLPRWRGPKCSPSSGTTPRPWGRSG